ncbi:MAG: hypothetical protein RLZZ501_1522 [Pseudomonadota bacterium]|jgi:putative photosynthetic complex assembly protein 2
MLDYVCPALYALFLWWFGTGGVLFLDGLPTATFRRTMVVATAVFAVSLLGLALTADNASVAGAYAAFTFGFFAWGWQEISFYLGYVTGPRRHACREGCSGWPHFLHGIQVTLYHEIKILVTAAVLLVVCWEAANPLALWSFLILWGMHQSAKLNVFLGVPNLSEDFLPDHLLFLRSFLTRRPMNLLFPLSVTVATVATAWMIGEAASAEPGSYQQTADTFLAALLVVGVLEHWFLVLPLPTAALWEWGLKSPGHRHPAASHHDDEPLVKSVADPVRPL